MRISGNERRNRIIEMLRTTATPLSGSQLANLLGVSRQVIVTDIALLKTSHPDLISTNSGYILMQASSTRRIYKMRHTDEQTEEELTGIVDLGGAILDVFVEHKVYGTIRVPLSISSKRDVQNFLRDMKSGVSTPLKNITQGYHYHTVEARSGAILEEIEAMLRQKGFLIETRNDTVIYSPKSYDEI